MKRAAIPASLLLAIAVTAQTPAQTPSWKLWSTYKDIGVQNWSPVATQAAPDGTFFTLGYTDNSALLEHFSDSGVLLWSKLIQSQNGVLFLPSNLALTPSSAYVITKSAGPYVWLSKFDYAGHLLWEKRIAFTVPTYYLRLAPAPNDSVYAQWPSAATSVSPIELDLARVSSTGNVLWQKNLGNTDGPLTSDSAGNAIVGMFGNDATFQKYSPDGMQLWSVTYDDPTHASDSPYSLTTDSSNNIYAAVWYARSASMAVKFSSSGSKIWDTAVNVDGPGAIQVNSSGSVVIGDYARSVAELTASGSIAFQSNPGTGNSRPPAIDGSGNVYMFDVAAAGDDIRKLDSTGSQLWKVDHAARFPGSIFLDSAGRVITTESLTVATSDPGSPVANFIGISALSASDGSDIWTNHPVVVGSDDSIRHSVTDPSGNTYVTGGVGFDAMSTFITRSFVAKYTASGAVAWANDMILGRSDAIIADHAGNTYVTYDVTVGPNNNSQARLRKFSSSGAVLWDAVVGTMGYAPQLLVDGLNNVYVLGSNTTSGEFVKFSPAGITIWDQTANVAAPTAAVLDSTGALYMGCTVGTHAVVTRVDSAGTVKWIQTYAIANSDVRALLVGPNDVAFAVGNDSNFGNTCRPYVAKIMPDGTTSWIVHPVVAGNTFTNVSAATIDASGIYVTGTTNTSSNFNVFTAKVLVSNAIAWVKTWDSGFDDRGLFIKNTINGLFVAGQNRSRGTAANYLLIRYSPTDGSLLFPNSGDVFTNGAILFDSRNDQDVFTGFGTDAKGNAYLAGISRGPNRTYDAHVVKYGPTDNDTFSSQSVPTTMVAGHFYNVSITFTNTGNTTWSEALKYRLMSVNPTSNTTWGFSRVFLQPGETIAPGQTKVWTFSVTAPSSPGTYNFQWRVGRENVGYVGVASLNVSVTVTSS